MKKTSPLVLAVGAAGQFAGLVVPELSRRGATVRGLIRNASEAAVVREHGAAEIAIGDLQDRSSLDAALKGVDSIFYIAPAFIAHEAKLGKDMVEAAKRAGVRRFVFSSVIHPVLGALENHSAKAPVEAALLESDMECVFLHPTLFFQNYARAWSQVVDTSVLAEPWSTKTRFSRVDYRDVAEVAAIALTEDRLVFGTYELCAEGSLDRHEVAKLISEVLGKHIEAIKTVPEPSTTGTNQQASPLKAMFDWYDKHSMLGNALVLRAILGREPRTLRAYFEELASHSTHGTT